MEIKTKSYGGEKVKVGFLETAPYTVFSINDLEKLLNISATKFLDSEDIKAKIKTGPATQVITIGDDKFISPSIFIVYAPDFQNDFYDWYKDINQEAMIWAYKKSKK